MFSIPVGLSDAGLHAFISSQKYDIGIATEYENCGVALMKYYKIPSIVSVSSLPILDRQSLAAGMPNSPAVTQGKFGISRLGIKLSKTSL